jgi:hypothetical protein
VLLQLASQSCVVRLGGGFFLSILAFVFVIAVCWWPPPPWFPVLCCIRRTFGLLLPNEKIREVVFEKKKINVNCATVFYFLYKPSKSQNIASLTKKST